MWHQCTHEICHVAHWIISFGGLLNFWTSQLLLILSFISHEKYSHDMPQKDLHYIISNYSMISNWYPIDPIWSHCIWYFDPHIPSFSHIFPHRIPSAFGTLAGHGSDTIHLAVHPPYGFLELPGVWTLGDPRRLKSNMLEAQKEEKNHRNSPVSSRKMGIYW